MQLADLHLDAEAAGIDQHGPKALACRLGGVGFCQNDKGVVVVAAGAASRPDDLHAVGQRGAFRLALHAVAAVEMQQLPLSEGQVQTGGGRLAQPYHAAAAVLQQRGAGDDVRLLVHAVEQCHRQAGHIVPQRDAQCLTFAAVVKGGGQAGQGVFAGQHLRPGKAQVGGDTAVRVLHVEAADAEIPHAAAGVFLTERIQRVIPLQMQFAGVGGKPAVRAELGIPQVGVSDRRTVVQMMQHALFVRPHLVAGAGGVQRDDAGLLCNMDTHNGYPPFFVQIWQRDARPASGRASDLGEKEMV